MKRFLIILLLILCYTRINALSTDIIVCGFITDCEGIELLLVEVRNIETAQIILSDFAGFYSICVPANSVNHLVFSHPDYPDVTMKINSNRNIEMDVIMCLETKNSEW